jgi:hypothetical protein
MCTPQSFIQGPCTLPHRYVLSYTSSPFLVPGDWCTALPYSWSVQLVWCTCTVALYTNVPSEAQRTRPLPAMFSPYTKNRGTVHRNPGERSLTSFSTCCKIRPSQMVVPSRRIGHPRIPIQEAHWPISYCKIKYQLRIETSGRS